jgi:hypothetical protein
MTWKLCSFSKELLANSGILFTLIGAPRTRVIYQQGDAHTASEWGQSRGHREYVYSNN